MDLPIFVKGTFLVCITVVCHLYLCCKQKLCFPSRGIAVLLVLSFHSLHRQHQNHLEYHFFSEIVNVFALFSLVICVYSREHFSCLLNSFAIKLISVTEASIAGPFFSTAAFFSVSSADLVIIFVGSFYLYPLLQAYHTMVWEKLSRVFRIGCTMLSRKTFSTFAGIISLTTFPFQYCLAKVNFW